jgi:ankyrin repeat protein
MRPTGPAAGWLVAALTVFGAARPVNLVAALGGPGLIAAVKNSDPAAVRALLQKHADINAADPDGTTALHWAAYQGEADVAALLIKAGANVNARTALGITPLKLAVSIANLPVVTALVNAGADVNAATGDGETVLMIAAHTGSPDIIKTLIGKGADVNAKTKGNQTPLMYAANEGHVPAIKALLAAGADIKARSGAPPAPARGFGAPAVGPDGKKVRDVTASQGNVNPRIGGFTPLLFAVRQGHLDATKALLDAGANVNDKLPDGSSALVLATSNAHYELGLMLVDRGADPNAADQGWTALHTVTWVRRPNFGFNPPAPVLTGSVDSIAFVKALLAKGANVNARITKEVTNGYRNALNRIGATPLMMAARLADAPLMKVFLEAGADPTIMNEDKTTLLMVASGVGIHSPGEDPGTEEEALDCVKIAMVLPFAENNINAIDDNGDTALHGAAYRGSNLIVQFLVDHGANTFEVKNSVGWTPLTITDGVFRTATYKEALQTSALLREMMRARGLKVPERKAPGSATN